MTAGDVSLAPQAARTRGYLLVLLAATLWATIGVIYSHLSGAQGLPPLALAAGRAGLGGLLLLAGLALLRPSALRIGGRALAVTLAYGVGGIAVFYAAYVYAVIAAGVAVASVLLYTAPAWVALIAWGLLGERLSRTHLAALGLTIAGAALVAGVSPQGAARLGAPAVLWGLAAGLTYAIWSVFNSIGVRHASPWTFQCYGMLTGAVVLLLAQPLAPLLAAARSPAALGWLALLAAGPTVGASVAYAAGVRRVPVSVASLVATLEPVIAAALAWLLLGERLSASQIAGGGLILSAVWLLRPGRAPASA
jgi:drug/metabolite transporter (DMT)-like permease